MHGKRTLVPALTLIGLMTGSLWSQDNRPVPPVPDYPRGNRSPAYVVDKNWPQTPDGVERNTVTGIAVDAKNQVWIATAAEPHVQVYSSTGKYIRGFGKGVLEGPHHLKIDHQGNIWVADPVLHAMFKFSPEGKLLMTLGIPGEFGEDERRLSQPTDCVVAKNGDIFVSDGYGNNRVVHYDANGKFVKQWGKLGSEPGEFCNPHAIAIDSQGRLYVADRYNGRVQVFAQDGKVLDVWDNIVIPWGLWITAEDDIWVCGSSLDVWPADPKALLGSKPKDQLMLKFDTKGKLRQLTSIPLGGEVVEPGQLSLVHCLALDKAGNLYCGDVLGKRAQKFVLAK